MDISTILKGLTIEVDSTLDGLGITELKHGDFTRRLHAFFNGDGDRLFDLLVYDREHPGTYAKELDIQQPENVAEDYNKRMRQIELLMQVRSTIRLMQALDGSKIGDGRWNHVMAEFQPETRHGH